jgi:hypothetical protein
MATDLALDPATGDLLAAPNKDLALCQGQATVEQRIRVRLRVIAGSWDADPTLGSALREAMRMSTPHAVQVIPLMVKEALSPMDDIVVRDVQCNVNAKDGSAVDFIVEYSMASDQGGSLLTTSVTSISNILEGVS